jgi:hypothetical protein
MANSSPYSAGLSGVLTSPPEVDKTPVDRNKRIKQAIWLYFFLLILEGALRKWVLPDLATPLLVVRDPVALLILIMSLQRGLFRLNAYIVTMWAVGVIAFCTAMLLGHGNITVALFGVRILVLQFPLLFVIGRAFDYGDVIKIGKVLLWMIMPMTLLITIQFYSPQSAWVNRGIGGDLDAAGFTGALGYLRPPGTFSFVSGIVGFYGLSAAYILFFWLDRSVGIKNWLLFAATACLLISIPVSISRTLFLGVSVSVLFAIILTTYKPKYLFRLVGAILVGGVLLFTLSSFNFFHIGVEAFTDRFTTANASEGGAQGVFLDRFLGGMIGGIVNAGGIPFFGFGIGMGTNAGAKLMTGEVTFLLSEGEWGRLIGEMGLCLGLIAISVRSILVVKMALRSFNFIHKKNSLPWMLTSFGFLNILQGQWAQPSALGFAILSGGLILASFKKRNVTAGGRLVPKSQSSFR